MDDAYLELHCLAYAALEEFGSRAIQLGTRKAPDALGLRVGQFGVQIWLISKKLETPGPDCSFATIESLVTLLDALERICNWQRSKASRDPPRRTTDFPNLLALRRKSIDAGALEFSLRGFLSSETNSAQKLRQFLESFEPPQQDRHTVEVASSAPEEYPEQIDATVYRVLRRHSQCQCPSAESECLENRLHTASLRLSKKTNTTGATVSFDTAYSAAACHRDGQHSQRWQLVRIHIPISSEGSRIKFVIDAPGQRAQIKDDVRPDRRIQGEADVHSEAPINSLAFCTLLNKRIGAARIKLRVVNDELFDLRQQEKPDQKVIPGTSVPLSAVLQSNRLSDEAKILLAYIIARSVWQFYKSDWMCARWTADRIHFMPTPIAVASAGRVPKQAISPLMPYVPISFALDNASPVESEIIAVDDAIHHAPRILALGVVLADLMRDDRPEATSSTETTWEELYNDELFEYHEIINDECWPHLKLQTEQDYKQIIRDAVRGCFDSELFNRLETTVDSRRDMLYSKVVKPLGFLASNMGLKENAATLLPRAEDGEERADTPQPRAQLLSQDASRSSDSWLAALADSPLNRDITKRCKADRGRRRTRIAILDTGYDAEADFFDETQRAKRIRGWKDFVKGVHRPCDVDGHGSHTLSLIMKVAPEADIFVARVAAGSDDFPDSSRNIADAIRWAVNECQVDIVSMSFGFPSEEHPRLISRSIQDAVTSREDKILFFAATSNDGANSGPWFPSTHEFVIPIRTTNHEGAFDDATPPADFSGADVYGTLGHNVRGASLSSSNSGDVVQSGSSCAAAIAAGIAALIIDDALALRASQDEDGSRFDKLWTRHGMRYVFALDSMSRKKSERCCYLSARPFCVYSEEDRAQCLQYALLQK